MRESFQNSKLPKQQTLDYPIGWKSGGEIENLVKTKKIDNKNVGKTESCPSSECTLGALLGFAENRSDIASVPYTLFTDAYFSR